MSQNYVYAVTRIRSHELKLLNYAFLEQLFGSGSEEAALKLLTEHGWGESGMSAEEILSAEDAKTWELIRELVPDTTVFNVFSYENDYHNLKAAIKEACVGGKHPGIYAEDGTYPAAKMEAAMIERDFASLPEAMREPAAQAMDLLLKTRDGQLCDCIIDRAYLSAVREAGKASGGELLPLYGELTAAIGNIKIAVRSVNTGKKEDFLKLSLAPCETLDVVKMAEACADGKDALISYLENTVYAEAAEEVKVSSAALERWCDNYLIRKIRPQQYNPFGIDPIAAYILARRMEIKSVRIILTGLRNEIPEEIIRERVRETYV